VGAVAELAWQNQCCEVLISYFFLLRAKRKEEKEGKEISPYSRQGIPKY
jgi:hypothetical protein